ncbi:very short patch repair endonuclease [Aestuariivivens sediminicola]|uniref:very short patch repair endonuclease n=1 Tax=Aestuariivivens sediminicola TaxID=2913560 RepID=UPI001F56A568|nr:very short patch repair endonuclease [Aestuariivivens sediminicola]
MIPISKSEYISKTMRANKSKNTRPELTLRRALYKGEIRGYRLHYKKAPGRPDITFVNKKIAVFINGCYWHRCPYCRPKLPKSNREFWWSKFEGNVIRDLEKYELLIRKDWRVVVVWECEIKKNINQVIKRIAHELK